MTDTVLVTRFCRLQQDGTLRSAYNNFPWPRSGPVSCDDWDPLPHCGNGSHGWLWGKGSGSAWDHAPSDVMLVVEVDRQDIVDLGGKVKFPKGNVIFCGSQEEVTRHMAERGHVGIAYGHLTVGERETAEVGYYGKATAGENGTATAGDFGTATAGENGKATAGDYGTANAGNHGKAIAGNHGKAIAGNHGKATAGVYGKAIAGEYGHATAGNWGTAMASHKGRIEIEWFDWTANRYRKAVGYIGENGLKPDTMYQVDDQGNFVEVTE